MHDHRHIQHILLCVILTLVTASPSYAWDVKKHDGRDYVTIDNISEFYGYNNRKVSGKQIILSNGKRSLRGELDSKELYINGIKFLLSYPIKEVNGELLVSRMDLSKLIEPILRPGKIQGAANFKTIILDPGHGGHDKGARGAWGNEKDFNLDVAKKARDLLTRQGYDVKMTRSTDIFIPLGKRAEFTNRHENAVFISIHFNSSSNRAASGIETFVLAPRGVPSFAQDGPRTSDFRSMKGNVRDAENIALATAMHASILRRCQLPDRGVKRARFLVIRDIKIPGILLEGGFLSNARDSRMVASSNFREQMAYGVVDAIRNYKVAVNGGTPADTTRISTTASNAEGSDGPTVIIKPN